MRINRRKVRTTIGAAAFALAMPLAHAACAPRNPCAGRNPCAARVNPCSPCAAKRGARGSSAIPCGANPCAVNASPARNPCAAKNPCASQNPCGAQNPSGARRY